MIILCPKGKNSRSQMKARIVGCTFQSLRKFVKSLYFLCLLLFTKKIQNFLSNLLSTNYTNSGKILKSSTRQSDNLATHSGNQFIRGWRQAGIGVIWRRLETSYRWQTRAGVRKGGSGAWQRKIRIKEVDKEKDQGLKKEDHKSADRVEGRKDKEKIKQIFQSLPN